MSYFCPCFTPTSIPNTAETLCHDGRILQVICGVMPWGCYPTWKRSGGLVETLRRKSEVGVATSVVVATQTFLYFQPLGDDPI